MAPNNTFLTNNLVFPSQLHLDPLNYNMMGLNGFELQSKPIFLGDNLGVNA